MNIDQTNDSIKPNNRPPLNPPESIFNIPISLLLKQNNRFDPPGGRPVDALRPGLRENRFRGERFVLIDHFRAINAIIDSHLLKW